MRNNHLVIMAGGFGSRLWPISTKECPKQFIDILGNGNTLIQETLNRFKDICPIENVWVVTSENYENIVKDQIPDIPSANILLEPCKRNTAPCIAYAVWKIQQRDPNANIVVTPSDHHITNVAEFRCVISSALEFVAENDAILTIGIKPSRPDTGYGYIKAMPGLKCNNNKDIMKVDSFKEKPDLATAIEYVSKEEFLWNSGIFVWNVNTILSAIEQYEPEIADVFNTIKGVFGTEKESSAIDEYFPKCNNISIDYAVLERAGNIYVYYADFGWNDLGTWGSLYDFLDHDWNENTAVASNVIIANTTGCIVHASGEKEIILIGLNNCIVAEHNGKLLVCKKEMEQLIKKYTE